MMQLQSVAATAAAALFNNNNNNNDTIMNDLGREAQIRWLKPVEIFYILHNYHQDQLTHHIPHIPPTSGSLYLYNKRVLKYFRKDGHKWRTRKNNDHRTTRTTSEAHERLKVGNIEALNCYYAHGEDNPNFQRRSYWILDPAYQHIVLVHYRDITQQNPTTPSHLSSFTINPPTTPTSFPTHQPHSSFLIGEFTNHNQSTPIPTSSVMDISSSYQLTNINRPLDFQDDPIINASEEPDLSWALQTIEHQLSFNDTHQLINDTETNTFYIDNVDHSNDLEDMLRDYEFSGLTPNHPDNLLLQHSDDGVQHHHHQLPVVEVDIWKDMLNSSETSPNVELQAHIGGQDAQNSSLMILQDVDSIRNPPAYSPVPHDYANTPHCYSLLFDQDDLGISLENDISSTTSQKQKFTIREISPDWCYTSQNTKVIIIGSFLCDPSVRSWACMFGDTEVPVEIIQEGVIRCYAPPHLRGKVTLCITSGNREPCSEVREFEYRAKPSVCTHSNPSETEDSKSSEELLLLVKFMQMLLSDLLPEGDVSQSETDSLVKLRMDKDSWSQIIDAISVGTSSTSKTMDWLLQELLKDKFEVWLCTKLEKNNPNGYSLSKKEQGIIHMVSALGFEWALQQILNSGVRINFRDINGWTALHWAARFGREKMVAALVASGASAGAVTDPSSQDPTGKTPASIAATYGHGGLAGYLSEVALTSHLSSLTLEESELSKGYAAVEAERTISNSLSNRIDSSRNEDEISLEQTLDAVRNAAQAAARIQSAFRAHSFRKRQQREVAAAAGDGYCILENNIEGLSAATKLAFRYGRDNNNSAALSIQKKYRGWKGRKEFLSLRQKVVKIQAHVRGYTARKNYRVCWAVSILEKVVLRWRRGGVGLRGFGGEMETTVFDDDDETSTTTSEDEEDILKVFRKQKVEACIEEAMSRVLSMVECPDARQQYHRILEKYREAKAELEGG